jgi:hypothetical protein
MSKVQEYKELWREFFRNEDASQQPRLLGEIGRKGRWLEEDARLYISLNAQPHPLNAEHNTQVSCPKCKRNFKNDHALRAHAGRMHKKEGYT